MDLDVWPIYTLGQRLQKIMYTTDFLKHKESLVQVTHEIQSDLQGMTSRLALNCQAKGLQEVKTIHNLS